MSNDSGYNLLEALRDVVIKPAPVIEYRLHYNSAGKITMCSMVDHPHSDQYLVVDQETYNNYFRYYVKDGKLEKIALGAGYMLKLVLSDHGYQVVRNHAGLILEPNETYKQTEFYAEPNS